MPKKAPELSALKVSRLTAPGCHAVGGVAGLLLQVTDTGARSWILRASIAGKRREMGLGAFPDVSLSSARERARAMRSKIAEGVDVLAERRAARASLSSVLTFKEAARRLIAAKEHEWKNPKHKDQWISTLRTYAEPKLGALPVEAIELRHVEAVLSPIWKDKTETASRLRSRIEAVLDWATVSGYRSGDNPARWKGNLEHVLAKPGKVKKKQNHPALPFVDMPRFMEALRQREGSARALEFAILTATRSNEVRGAAWDEIDLDAKTWTIPAERMKAAREHVVPLSAPAIRLIKSLPRFAGTDLMFPGERGGQLSDMTLSKLIKLMHKADTEAGGVGFMDPKQGRLAVPHGFRSSFRDWAAERTNYPRDVAEMALAHTIGDKVEAAYRRGDLFTKRTKMMADWAKFIETMPAVGNVTPIRRKTG